MSEKIFTLIIHHGGSFTGGTRERRYVGGRVTQVCDDLDIDKVSYPEILSYVKEDLRYELESIIGLYYFRLDNFVFVQDDHTLLSIVNELPNRAKLEFYVDHKICGKERGVIEVEGSSQGVNNVGGAALQSDIDGNLNSNQDTEIMVHEGMDDSVRLPHQNFDNFNVDVDFLTDDDDDELQESRENVKAFKSKNTFETNGEDCSPSDDEMDTSIDEAVLDAGDDDLYTAGSESDNDSTESFYYDSDGSCGYYSETDEECGDAALRRPSERVRFDPTAAIPTFCCNMVFQNVQECRNALAKYAIMKGLQIRYIKNDQVRIRARCMEKCPWTFLASKDSHSTDFTVKTYVPKHDCHRKNTNPMATSKNLAMLLKDRLMATPFIKYKDLKSLCKTELKLRISLTQARNIRKKVIVDLLGSYADEYRRLHDYVQEINSSNPGTTCVVKASRDEGGDINYFRSFYVCFAACKKGWAKGCRKIIGLDGCFLKGVCKGQLLCAVGRDGNNQMFPIAWAVVSVENKENWSWFLNLLKYDLSFGEGAGLTIISDMQKGLDSAINEHLPEVEHRMCARHVYAAWAKKWRGEERKIAFWNCARSTFENDLKSKVRELAVLGNGIVEDFMRYNIESFSKVYFRTTPKCDAVDNNMAETFNGWILDARCKPIISMLEEIRIQVMKRLHVKRKFCSTWICDVGPRPMQKLEKNTELSFQWEMIWNGDYGYEVYNVYNHDNRHIVNLKSLTCTCREWDLTGIPCQHAVCALHSAKLEPKDFIAHWYREATYLKAYQFMMQPVRGKILWVESGKEEIAPPPHKKLPGRPKVKRRKDKHEVQKIGKLTRKGRIMTCKLCKQRGHNRRKCTKNMSVDIEGNIRSMDGNQQYAPDQAPSQIQQPVTTGEIMKNRASERQNNLIHLGKRSRTHTTVTQVKLPTGYGCYVNENTGQTILNPGTKSMQTLHGARAHQTKHSQDAKKDSSSSKNWTASGLQWKGKSAVTTKQLQVEAQRRMTSVASAAKGIKRSKH